MNFKRITTAIVLVGLIGGMSGAFANLGSTKTLSLRGGDNENKSRAGIDTSGAVYDSSRNDYGRGSIVQYGVFGDGTKQYWKNFWLAIVGDIPGQLGDSVGNSFWQLINSQSYSDGKASGNPGQYQWVGWNSGAGKWSVAQDNSWVFSETQTGTWGDQIDKNGPGAYIPTWRDGSEGCYTMIHEDLGAMSLEGSVMSANEVGLDHPRIRVGWGVKVNSMDATEWKVAQKMVMDGHEITNHSFDHSSAGNQWQWYYIGDQLQKNDIVLPKEIRNLIVADPSGSFMPLEVDIPYVDYENGDITKPIKLYKRVTFQVSTDYVYRVDSTYIPSLGKYEYDYSSTGTIKAENKGWGDGKMVDVLKIFCAPGWSPTRTIVNISGANDIIDKELYSKIDSPRHPKAKECEYYNYPYSVFSDATHDALFDAGIIGAMGGSKSGVPTPADFFNPYRIDFDAFFMLDANATTVFPNNPHQHISLNGLVDRIYKTKGYMIRLFHAIVDVSDWLDAMNQSKGGWWGGMPKSLYEKHFTYLDGLIDNHKITVATPSEAIKYRITANAATGAIISENGKTATVTVIADAINDFYKDEISVIVVLSTAWNEMKVTYDDGIEPRYRARKMGTDGKAWSVSVNPYEQGGKVTLTEETPTPIDPVVYTGPADVTGFHITDSTNDGLSLGWTSSVSSGVDKLLISWDEGAITDVADALTKQHVYLDDGVTSYDIAGLTNGTKYSVKIFVHDTNDNWSIGVGDIALIVEINLYAPVSLNDVISLSEGATATTLLSGASSVLANDSDADGMKRVTASIESNPSHGTVTMSNNGTFSYAHNGSENFTDQFTYRANDGVHDGNIATVNIGISPVNDNTPVAVIDTIILEQGAVIYLLKNGSTSVLNNDTDVDIGDSLTVSLHDSTENGFLSLNSDGTFLYKHDNSGNLTDNFIYAVVDKAGHASAGLVTILIDGTTITEIGISESELKVFTAVPNPVPEYKNEAVLFVSEEMVGEGEIKIYDIIGNTLDRKSVTVRGNEIYRWDLRNQNGHEVGSGNYIAKLRIKRNDGTVFLYKTIIGVKR